MARSLRRATTSSGRATCCSWPAPTRGLRRSPSEARGSHGARPRRARDRGGGRRRRGPLALRPDALRPGAPRRRRQSGGPRGRALPAARGPRRVDRRHLGQRPRPRLRRRGALGDERGHHGASAEGPRRHADARGADHPRRRGPGRHPRPHRPRRGHGHRDRGGRGPGPVDRGRNPRRAAASRLIVPFQISADSPDPTTGCPATDSVSRGVPPAGTLPPAARAFYAAVTLVLSGLPNRRPRLAGMLPIFREARREPR